VSFSPAPTTVTSVTSATPIISAAAVPIVRPGWRIALRRASPPAAPPIACAGRPISDAIARTMRPGSRTRPAPGVAECSASTGATRVACQAGTRPAISVTSVPTRSETTIVRSANTVPASGSERPIESNSASSAFASPRPASRPMTEASRPTASASTSTEPSTWRRYAPTIRSRPSSRVRWATVIESVLKIVNAPTRIATPPKISSAILMIEMKSSSPSSVKRSCFSALVTWVSGSACARSERSCAAGMPSRPATSTPSSLSPRPNSFCAAARSNTADVAVPSDLTLPKRVVRRWDVAASRHVTAYIANFALTAQRIADFYGREASVVHPPVDVERFDGVPAAEDFLLLVGELTSHKNPGRRWRPRSARE
jgi:hypothetical protein